MRRRFSKNELAQAVKEAIDRNRAVATDTATSTNPQVKEVHVRANAKVNALLGVYDWIVRDDRYMLNTERKGCLI